MTLAGVFMVHDEAGTVGRAVESFGRVCDHMIGLDVGSTDGAAEICRDLGVAMYSQEWTTHGAAAEKLLLLARETADYAFFFGATETVEQTGPMPLLDAPCYLINAVHEGLVFQTVRLFDTDIDWSCPGPVHSVIKPDFYDERVTIDSLMVTVHDDDGRRDGKLERYRVELEEWLKDNPRDSRSIYYLAQNYYCQGNATTAGGLYALRARMTSGDEEQWHALYMAGACEMRHSAYRGMQILLEAWKLRPERMEPLHAIELACQAVRAQTPIPSDQTLFVAPDLYAAAEV